MNVLLGLAFYVYAYTCTGPCVMHICTVHVYNYVKLIIGTTIKDCYTYIYSCIDTYFTCTQHTRAETMLLLVF